MKTFTICLLLCALAAYSYAAPSSDRAIVEALINNMEDAELESLFGVEQDNSDEELAQLEALLDQNAAEIQWGKIGSIIKKAKRGMQLAKKGMQVVDALTGGGDEGEAQPGNEEIAELQDRPYWNAANSKQAEMQDEAELESLFGVEQDDSDEELAQLEALLDQKAAEIQWGGFSKLIKKAKNVVKKTKKVVDKGMNLAKKGMQIYDALTAPDQAPQEQPPPGNEEIAELEALLDGEVQLEALLDEEQAKSQVGPLALTLLSSLFHNN